MSFALTGDFKEAEKISEDLNKRFPEDTIVQSNFLPVIRTASLLQKNPSQAIAAIAPAQPFELGFVGNGASFNGYPVYFRGEALLANHQGAKAAAAFQEILDHPGVILNEPIGALAHLELARAYVMSEEPVKAEAAYKDFLSLWKNADPDIPVYRQAQAEYKQLSHS
jgi:hypothetical protein